METEIYKRNIATAIKKRVVELRARGQKTSKGELISLAAIGRTLDPPVSRVTVYQVINGNSVSRRVKEAVERELGQAYWVRKNAA